MFQQLVLMTLTVGVVVNYGACTQQDSKVWTKTFLPHQLTTDKQNITCSVPNDGTLDSWSWSYFTTSESEYIIIYDGVQLTYDNYTYISILTLDDYNAGTYRCIFYFNNKSPMSAKIKISTMGSGSDLYEICGEDHDCNALHATCTEEKMCQCSGQYNITYSKGNDTLSCLKLQPEGGHCFSDTECNWPTQSYLCLYNQCTCTGQMTEVRTHGNSTLMCIQPAELDGNCYYDEQCKLATEHSYCYDNGFGIGYCDCEGDYTYGTDTGESYSYNYCYKPMEDWTVAYIAVVCAIGVCLIAVVIICYITDKHKRPCARRRPSSSSQISIVSTANSTQSLV